jgi:hypothetical protein
VDAQFGHEILRWFPVEVARAPFGVELSSSIGRLTEHRREAIEEPMPSLFSRRRSVSAVEERALFGVDEARAAADCLEFHRAERRGYVRSMAVVYAITMRRSGTISR